MRQLKDLIPTSLELKITGICEDSREVKEGYIFVATKGYNVDHFDFISAAVEKGAVFLVVDREINFVFPHIVVDNINSFYINLCKKYYEINLDDFYLIGITGTDGKTSTATMVYQLLDNCAYIGTNGLTIHDRNYPLSNTTPCVAELYECFSKIKNENIFTVVMEVSSEAILHGRIEGLLFDIIAFTNITEDHIMVHHSFHEYFKCKLQLLKYVKKDGFVIVNNDDRFLCKIKCTNMYTFGKDMSSNCVIKEINLSKNNSEVILENKGKVITLNSPYYGEYNVYNFVEAFLIGLVSGKSLDSLLCKVLNLSPIRGRGEILDFGQDYTIVLDYAHTINGVKSILEAYQNYDKVITVTGAAGGRDAYKRPIIGDMVIKMSDVSIFTMDDPRYEDVDKIIDEMAGTHEDYIRIKDRKKAINYALSIAHKNSAVLIIGKGRDNYMAVEDKKIPYSDYDVIRHFFGV